MRNLNKFIFTLWLVSFTTSTTEAQIEKFAPFIGKYEGVSDPIVGFEGMQQNGPVKWETKWRWLSNKTAVEHTWRSSYINDGKNQSTGTQVFYLDAETHALKTTGFGVDGEATNWSNTGNVEFIGKGFQVTINEKTFTGTVSSYVLKNTKLGRNQIQSQLSKMVVGGKKVSTEFKRIATRVKRDNNQLLKKVPLKCPWEWMLGDWEIERNDGSKAKVNWIQPKENADFLYGTWIESDGSIVNDMTSWQSDRGHVTSNGHGADGSFVSVNFTHVELHKMNGTISKRDNKGNVLTGIIAIERVSPTEAHTKILTTDGKVVTEVLSAVN